MSRAGHVCPSVGCSAIVLGSQRYCDQCEDAHRKSDRKKRGSIPGYGKRWRLIRDEHLRLEPFCVDCGRNATEVDHIVPKRKGGSDDHSNLASRCKSCHSRKTAKFDGGFGNSPR